MIDYGLHEGRLYIVTEYVDGVPLDEHCGPSVGLSERVGLLAAVADAVQTLHEHGVLHRDLKPSNILIDGRGSPVIIDLGIATLLSRDVMQTLTAEGAPIGTPAFMAPEQARGEREGVSTRSDIYALGATAYLILTGHTPHDVAPDSTPTLAAAVQRVAHEPAREPRELSPGLPRGLAAILTKATDPRPSRRYASAGGMAEDLRRWLRGEAVLASPPTPWGRTARWMGRHPVATTAAACGVILALTAGATTLLGRLIYIQPYAVVVDAVTQSRADLVTITGRPLATWRGGVAGTVRFAELIEVDGEPRVLIGWGPDAECEERGALAAYDPSSPGRPVWVKGVGDVDLLQPEPSPDGYANHFTFHIAMVRDVFPEVEGDEIIATHGHRPFSPTAIRVYDRAGEVLYETWHDGHIFKVHWLAGPGLIVAHGANCDAKWSELGFGELTNQQWPQVLFAVRPMRGARRGFIETAGGLGDVAAAWYKYLVPPGAANELFGPRSGLAVASPAFDPRTHFRWSFVLEPETEGSGTLVVDSAGVIVDRFHSDTYPRPGRPAVAELGLVDVLPVAAPVESLRGP